MTRLGCQWDQQPIAALPFPVAEGLSHRIADRTYTVRRGVLSEMASRLSVAALPVQLGALEWQRGLLIADQFSLLAGLNGMFEHWVALHHRGVLGRVAVALLQLPVVLIRLDARLVARHQGLIVPRPLVP
jgi:hypothetical protein